MSSEHHDRLMRIEAKLDALSAQMAEQNLRYAKTAAMINTIPCASHASRISRLEITKQKALAVWGIVVLVAAAVISVAWDFFHKWTIEPYM